MRRSVLAVFATALVASAAPARGQDLPALDPRGRMLIEIIDSLERDLEDLHSVKRELDGRIRRFEAVLQHAESEYQQLDTELQETNKRIVVLLRSVVRMKKPDDLLMYLSTMKYHDLYVYDRVVKKIVVALVGRLTNLLHEKEAVARKVADLSKAIEDLRTLEQKTIESGAMVRDGIATRREALKERNERILAIESLFATALASPADEAAGLLSEPEQANPADNAGASPGGMEELYEKEELRLPVSPGKKVKNFEEIPEAPYGTEKMVRGWILVPFVKDKSAPPVEEAAVNLPFQGEVVFIGSVPDFGLTVIVDHGQIYHSVFSNIAHTAVVKGQKLETGQLLGLIRSDHPGKELPYLYFELRENRIAVDPRPWFLIESIRRKSN